MKTGIYNNSSLQPAQAVSSANTEETNCKVLLDNLIDCNYFIYSIYVINL